MKHLAIAAALVALACATPSSGAGGSPPTAGQAQPAQQGGLMACQKDLDCIDSTQCVEGYCRKT